MFALLADSFILLAGVAYPAYASFKAIKYRNVNGYVKWMCYWVVYAAYTIGERTVGALLLFWIPGYDVLRCLFVLWLVAPFTRGAQLLYKHVLHPQLSKHEPQIDTVSANYADALKQGGTGLLRYAAGVVFQSVMKANTLLFSYVQAHSLAHRRAAGPVQYGGVTPVGYYQPVYGGAPALMGPAVGVYPGQPYPGVDPAYDYFGNAQVQRTFSMESLTDGFECVDRPSRSRSSSENERTGGVHMHESLSQPMRIAQPAPLPPLSDVRARQSMPATRTQSEADSQSSQRRSVNLPPKASPASSAAANATKKSGSVVSAALNALERGSKK